MADAMSPESSGQGSSTPESAAQGAQTAINAGDAKVIESLKKQMESQSAIIRRLTEKMEKMGEPKEEKAKPRGPISTLSDDMKAIKDQLAAQKARADKAQMHSAQQQIRSMLSEGGIDPALARLASETVLNRVRGSLQFQDDGTGTEVPVIAEEGGNRMLSEFVSDWLQSDEGKALAPSKPAPSLFGTPRNASAANMGKIRATQSDLLSGRVKTADVLAGKVVIVDAG